MSKSDYFVDFSPVEFAKCYQKQRRSGLTAPRARAVPIFSEKHQKTVFSILFFKKSSQSSSRPNVRGFTTPLFKVTLRELNKVRELRLCIYEHTVFFKSLRPATTYVCSNTFFNHFKKWEVLFIARWFFFSWSTKCLKFL